MDSIDFALLVPAVLAPLAVHAVGPWSWTAWLPIRLRAIENRRAREFVRNLGCLARAEKFPLLFGADDATDECAVVEPFEEVAEGVARLLAETKDPVRTFGGVVVGRLISLSNASLPGALEPTSRTNERARRRQLALACLDIATYCPLAADGLVLGLAANSADSAIAERAAGILAAMPRKERPKVARRHRDGDLKVYRRQTA